jgi:hypothetical protein
LLDGGCLDEALDELISAWVKTYNIRPELDLHADVMIKIRARGSSKIEQVYGEIVEINYVDATYVVRVPSHGHTAPNTNGTHGYIVAYEMVSPVEEKTKNETIRRGKSNIPLSAS